MEVTVKSKYNGTAPRKLRLVADLVRGWDANKALDQLRFIPKAAAQDITKTLKSAFGSAKEGNLDLERLFIKVLTVDEGPAMKRRVYMSRGRASQIKKHLSHITLTLAEKEIEKPTDSKIIKDNVKNDAETETPDAGQKKEK